MNNFRGELTDNSAKKEARVAMIIAVLCSADDVLDPQVPGLESISEVGVPRWKPGMTFGQFSEHTFNAYYD